MDLKVDRIERGSEAEVRLIGEIDATNAPEVDKLLLDAVAGHDSLVLDMEGLAYVSSAGLRAFKHAYTEMQKKGGTLSAKNAGEVVQDVLKVTGFARMFKMI